MQIMRQVLVVLDLPNDWGKFRLPSALHDQLQELLYRQDANGNQSAAERREWVALTELVDILSLMKLRAELTSRKKA